MTSVSKAYTAVGASDAVRVGPKESFTYVVSGSATASWAIQKKVGSGAWATVASGTADQTILTLTNDEFNSVEYRSACTAYTSGTMTVVVADVDGDVLPMPAAGFAAELVNNAGETILKVTETGVRITQKPVVLTASTTITPAAHAGRPILLSAAAGLTATLPAATGTGDLYEFIVLTTVTSNAAIIKVANATDTMVGLVLGLDGDGVPANAWTVGTTDDTVNMDGSTQGGLAGDRIVVRDIAAGKFFVNGFIKQSDTEATPMAATVS